MQSLLDEWDLRPDGVAAGRVLPVRAGSTAAALKIGTADGEHLALRRWGGDGAVRLLRADPHRQAVLLERLGVQTANDVSDHDACVIVAGLYRRLHVPAMPQLGSVTAELERWADDFARLPRSAPIPHRLVEQAIALCRELATAQSDRLLHGDLHYGRVLAADREPWLAIAPRPINGDPSFELAPMLWNRWDDIEHDTREGVRHRFFTLVDAAGFDEDLARAWVLVRVVRGASLALGQSADSAMLTRLVTLAKAVQD